MRNLKRALSLLLSSTMVLGMLVMGGSAAGYKDVDASNDHQEAIEVLQAVGIMTGDQNGNFNPDGSITRNEMAVIMCNLLDYTVASYKGTAPFTDVPAWAEPYVAACYTNGITAGISATQYGGNQTVTTGEAALMLLKALGYFQYSGDFGQDWLVETTKTGSTAGLFGGVKNGAREALTRNDVAQMVLNTLKADVVVAEKNGSDITVGDIVISGGKATYTARVSTDSDYKAISDAKVDGKYTVQLGEELYDGKLVKAGSAEDDFGRPSVKWTYKSQEVGVYSDEAEAVYTASVEKQELYDLIGSEVYNDLKNNKADFSVYVDGVQDKNAKLSEYIVKNSSTDIDYARKGATTEVFVDDDNNVVITVINTYVAQVDGDYDKDDKELYLTTVNDDKKFPSVKNMTLSADDFDYLNAYSDEDYVLVTVAGDEIKTIEKAETVTGTMDAYTKDKSITVDNTKYEYSKNYAGEIKEPELGEKYVVVLDANGYVVYTDGVEASDNYVYVASMDNTSGVKKNLEADAYFADGTNKVIIVDKDDSKLKNHTFGWFSYDEKSNGKYELEFVTYQYNGTKSSGNIIKNGKVTVDNGIKKYSANTATTFVVNDDDKITVYNGIKNVPTIDAKGPTTVSVLMKDKDSKYADMVYISGKSLSISGDSGDRVYILDTASSAKKDADGNKYYVYDAIVNGKVTTVNALEYKLPVGLYEANYDKNGYMRNDKAVDSKTGDFRKLTISQAEYADGVLTLGSTAYVLADNYKIFVNDDGDAKTVSASKLADKFAEYKDTVYLYMNDDDQVVEVYVMAKAETEKPKEPEVTGYKVVKTNAGDITVTLKDNQVEIANAKVVDSNDKNYNYGKATLKFKVEVRDGGYQEEVTFTAPASTANTGEYAGCMIDGTFALPYKLAAGTYRVTVTVSNDTIGELTIGSTTATVQ